jgi:hypothetical protein
VKYTQTAGIYQRRLTTRYWPVASVLGYLAHERFDRCQQTRECRRRRLDHDWLHPALATVIPVTGWAADRFGTKRLFMKSGPGVHPRLLTVRTSANHAVAHPISCVAGVGRRHVAAVGDYDLDARSSAEAAGSPDGGARHTRSANGWAHPGWPAHWVLRAEGEPLARRYSCLVWPWWRPRSSRRHFCPTDRQVLTAMVAADWARV